MDKYSTIYHINLHLLLLQSLLILEKCLVVFCFVFFSVFFSPEVNLRLNIVGKNLKAVLVVFGSWNMQVTI